MIAALQAENARIEAENAKMSATLRVHDQLVQALRLRIAKLQKMAFGKSSERIEREIPSRAIGFAMPCRAAEQLELALEDLLVAVAEEDDAPIDEGQDEPASDASSASAPRRPRVSRMRHRVNAMSLILVPVAPTVAEICTWWARMSANFST
ncbi:hypothetical protein DT23_10390 [Thioclava indica]|uniref:Transposase TnpC homeodomain domain-containing protein n=1 Tax=Thioclava indica TaxID=1353528 RepID=A0A074JZ29_9RHOB|nr:hypothetical protein DT23_10390 [Thioclava indica]